MKKTKNSKFVNSILHIIGVFLCVVPPLICTLSYFPLWIYSGAQKSIAGGAALLIILCAAPLIKLVRRVFDSPASYLMWLCAFVLFLLLSKIADQMIVISFVGFVSNAVGAVCFAIARRGKSEEDG